ncbi:uncharacterized protein TNCT_667231 [Trichonephila clavata]|uniref:MUM1-like PWWP domain-containing protein n=1 Tax=Trichonephila clavata TaxID=2740835 RepID=A0A8X6JUA1_TRICU|nr:uncharacterized protein TNCT_667231 [Trichonephila clavata]
MDDISASKNCNSDANSDSSEDLPVISPQSFDIGNLQKNDIVWAEYKHLYWPAVVRHVNKKNRKVSVLYCDSPLKTFKLPFRKIHSFNDMEFRKKVQDQEKSPQIYCKHLKVVSMAAAFSHRRAMGKCDDPVSFFDTSKPYFAFQNTDFASMDEIGSHSIQESENEGNNISSVQSGSKISKLENDESCSVEINSEISEKFEDSDSTESSDRENPVPTNSHDLLLDDCSNDCDEKTANAIVSCIKSGCLDQYLLDIHRGKIKSRNHDIFNQAKEVRNKDVLQDCSSTIEIATEKMKDVAHYLQGLYDRRVKKKKKDFMWGEIDYIVTVWTYDAIDKALSLIQSEPSKYFIDSNSANCSSPSNEHSSFTKDHDNLNSKSAKRKSSDSNADEPKGKEVCGKSCQKKSNAKKTTEGRKNLKNMRKRNYVPTSMSLRSSKALGKTNSDVSTECEKILTLKPRTFFQMGTIHFNFPSKKALDNQNEQNNVGQENDTSNLKEPHSLPDEEPTTSCGRKIKKPVRFRE